MGDFVSGDRALVLLVALNGWIAWRYSRVPLGQDEGLWMLWGWTGAVPYRDHIDCKPPGIQIWLWLLAKLTRRNIAATRAITHLAIGAFAVAATAITGELAAGLLFTAIAQSSLLLAYHAWVEPLSAGFLLLALVSPPWVAAGCLALAMLFNLKLGPPGLAILLIHGWWLQLAAAAAIAVLILVSWRLLRPAGFRAVWFGVVELPRRMTARRKSQGHPIVPHWTPYFSTPLLLMAPALGAAIAADRHAVLWIPCALYMGLNLCGRVWRPYHWIPVAAFAAAAAPAAAPLILLAEWCASGLYLGNVERSPVRGSPSCWKRRSGRASGCARCRACSGWTLSSPRSMSMRGSGRHGRWSSRSRFGMWWRTSKPRGRRGRRPGFVVFGPRIDPRRAADLSGALA